MIHDFMTYFSFIHFGRFTAQYPYDRWTVVWFGLWSQAQQQRNNRKYRALKQADHYSVIHNITIRHRSNLSYIGESDWEPW